ncbi:MAG: type II toxin-antitoxin system RelE/ParE family toxin [Algicola sp.]|nr:type II toxin-antitoxin system RelE/ParE family toxin [Algicola sp.]
MTVCYSVHWKNSAKKELKNLDRNVIPAIIAAVEKLAVDPLPSGTKKLQGSQHTYRIRVRDYRIVYSIKNNVLVVEVLRVAHRKEAYR